MRENNLFVPILFHIAFAVVIVVSLLIGACAERIPDPPPPGNKEAPYEITWGVDRILSDNYEVDSGSVVVRGYWRHDHQPKQKVWVHTEDVLVLDASLVKIHKRSYKEAVGGR